MCLQLGSSAVGSETEILCSWFIKGVLSAKGKWEKQGQRKELSKAVVSAFSHADSEA